MAFGEVGERLETFPRDPATPVPRLAQQFYEPFGRVAKSLECFVVDLD